MSRPLATLSLDLDDVWAYLRTHGDAGWRDAPTLLPRAVERLICLLDELDLRMTVFVVGRDAQTPAGHEAVSALAAAGHEVASHSFLHRDDLASLEPAQIADDLARTAKAIIAVTGRRPTGFRCPSYGRSPTLLQTLVRQGYAYDASVLPTCLAPLLRLHHRATMSQAARRATGRQRDLFGPAANALLPLSPFCWDTDAGLLLELPITTFPLLRTPIHASYLQALAARSPRAAHAYLRSGLRACRRRGIAPSFLLHPPDVCDDHDVPSLSYLPGMARPWPQKVDVLRRTLTLLADDFQVVPLNQAAEVELLSAGELRVVATRASAVGPT
ncbi:MAG: polysaccharide deacetylase family protein [Egibacteraceae bacterium]